MSSSLHSEISAASTAKLGAGTAAVARGSPLASLQAFLISVTVAKAVLGSFFIGFFASGYSTLI